MDGDCENDKVYFKHRLRHHRLSQETLENSMKLAKPKPENTKHDSGCSVYKKDTKFKKVSEDITKKWSDIHRMRKLLKSLGRIPLKGFIEKVYRGTKLAVVLQNEDRSIRLLISGIKCQKHGQYGKETRNFIEKHVLYRNVEIVLESVYDDIFIGTIFLANDDNLAEMLLREGLAETVDWMLEFTTNNTEMLKDAELEAKIQKLGIWQESEINNLELEICDVYSGTIINVVNYLGFYDRGYSSLGFLIQCNNWIRKIYLSSIWFPREGDNLKSVSPWLYKGRNYLCKNLIGKQIDVTLDYLIENRPYGTVMCENVDVGKDLVAKGYALVWRHSLDDKCTLFYNKLLKAEYKANENGRGIHSLNIPPVIFLDPSNSAQYFKHLIEFGAIEAYVEGVLSGTKLKVYISKLSCIGFLVISGITIAIPDGSDEELARKEARDFTTKLCLQKNVVIKVEHIDKGGNLIGSVWIDAMDLAGSIIEAGFADLHRAVGYCVNYKPIMRAKKKAEKLQ